MFGISETKNITLYLILFLLLTEKNNMMYSVYISVQCILYPSNWKETDILMLSLTGWQFDTYSSIYEQINDAWDWLKHQILNLIDQNGVKSNLRERKVVHKV